MDLKKMINDFKTRWTELDPDVKKKLMIFFVFAVLVGSLSGLIYQKKQQQKNNVSAVEKKYQTEEEIDTDLLKKTQYYETMKLFEELKKSNEELKKKIASLEEERKKEEEAGKKEPEEKEKQKEKKDFSLSSSFPPPPPPPQPFLKKEKKQKTAEIKEVVLGGIEVVSEKVGSLRKESAGHQKTNEVKKKYYLPPSFMQATLLSGLDAPAVSKGNSNPVPVLLRIKAPAVLPNRVKANLKGCFIIAEGVGNLATERADLRLVSLSCIDYKGRAVIDQKIKGFVVDTDGKIGLRGRVVSKMGSVLARTLLAGFVSGIGQAFSYSTYDYSISGEGAVLLPKPGKALSTGLAGGVQSAANELMRFYMELARQTIPVVEILPTRTVTVVISEGVELKVKQYDF